MHYTMDDLPQTDQTIADYKREIRSYTHVRTRADGRPEERKLLYDTMGKLRGYAPAEHVIVPIYDTRQDEHHGTQGNTSISRKLQKAESYVYDLTPNNYNPFERLKPIRSRYAKRLSIEKTPWYHIPAGTSVHFTTLGDIHGHLKADFRFRLYSQEHYGEYISLLYGSAISGHPHSNTNDRPGRDTFCFGSYRDLIKTAIRKGQHEAALCLALECLGALNMESLRVPDHTAYMAQACYDYLYRSIDPKGPTPALQGFKKWVDGKGRVIKCKDVALAYVIWYHGGSFTSPDGTTHTLATAQARRNPRTWNHIG